MSDNHHHYKVEYLFNNTTQLTNFTRVFYNQPEVTDELKKYWTLYLKVLWNRILSSDLFKVKVSWVRELEYNPEDDYVNLNDEWDKEDKVCKLDPSLAELRMKLFS